MRLYPKVRVRVRVKVAVEVRGTGVPSRKVKVARGTGVIERGKPRRSRRVVWRVANVVGSMW